eukprot:5677828-Amphidinium_carterae.1
MAGPGDDWALLPEPPAPKPAASSVKVPEPPEVMLPALLQMLLNPSSAAFVFPYLSFRDHR